jgi:Tol biopolymer transport system component
MEFVEGETLGEILDRRVPPLVDTIRYGSEIAEGLANAHARGIVHRDVKPSNVMVTPHGHIKLLDFGIARINSDIALTQSGLTLPGSIPGTPQYMAPEQALGRPLDGRADLFSLGVLLFRCLTGQLPFEGVTRDEYIQQMLAGRTRPLDQLAPDAPASVRDVVKACLQLDPDRRPQSASIVAETLRHSAEALSTSTLPIASPPSKAPAWMLWSLGMALVVAAIVFAATRWKAPIETPIARTLVPAVTWPSIEQGARVSPDGRWLSFVSDRQNQSSIYVQAIDGGDPVRVAIQGTALSHVWSPDSRELAVLVRQGQSHLLVVVPAFFGGSPRASIALDPALSDIAVVRWINDDVYLDVNRGQPGRSLLRAALASSTVTDVSAKWPDQLRFRSADVSSDGKRVVVAAAGGDLFVAALDGSGVQRMTEDEYADRYPMWIDEDTIAFESNRGGQLDLWEMSTATRAARQLTSSQMRDEPTGASLDGRVIAFEQAASQVNLWRLELADGTVRQLTADSLSDFWPSINKGSIAFQRMKPASVEGFQFFDTRVLVAPLTPDSLEPQVVADGFSARLSPDGRWLAYYQRIPDRNHLRLFVKNLATGESRTLSDRCVLPAMTAASLPVDFVEQNVTWSSSGSTLYYIVATDGGHEIQAADLAGSSPPATLVPAVGNTQLSDLRISPDGEKLAYAGRVRAETGTTPRYEIRVRFLREQRDRVLMPGGSERSPLSVSGWSRDDAVIAHRRTAPAGQLFDLEIVEVPLEGARRTIAAVSDSAVPAVRVDPAHGRLFLTRSIDGVHNIYAVSLRDGTQRQLTTNHAPGVSFSGIQPLQDEAIVFAREEWKRDIWLLTAGSPRQ